MSNTSKCQCGAFVATHCRRCKRVINGVEIDHLRTAALNDCHTMKVQHYEMEHLSCIFLTEHKASEWLRDELAKKTQELASIRLPWYARRWYAAVRWLTTFDRGDAG